MNHSPRCVFLFALAARDAISQSISHRTSSSTPFVSQSLVPSPSFLPILLNVLRVRYFPTRKPASESLVRRALTLLWPRSIQAQTDHLGTNLRRASFTLFQSSFTSTSRSITPHPHHTQARVHHSQLCHPSTSTSRKRRPLGIDTELSAMSPFKFGHFDAICERAALTICPLIGTDLGVMPTCYSRNVQLGSQIIFQPGTFTAVPASNT